MVDDKKAEIKMWINLSLSDLKSSKLLHEQQQYRTSYFLFQQASEKANKAFALKFGLIKVEKLRGIGHDQLKIDRSYLTKQLEDIKINLKEKKENSSKLLDKYKKISNHLTSILKLNNEDLVNISTIDLNFLYNELNILTTPFIKKYPEFKELYKRGSGGTLEGLTFIKHVIKWTQDLHFIKLTFQACAILTLQHVTLTRYPQNAQNPIKIYTKKLPLVRKQLLFMNLLEKAIHKLDKHSELQLVKKQVQKSSR